MDHMPPTPCETDSNCHSEILRIRAAESPVCALPSEPTVQTPRESGFAASHCIAPPSLAQTTVPLLLTYLVTLHQMFCNQRQAMLSFHTQTVSNIGKILQREPDLSRCLSTWRREVCSSTSVQGCKVRADGDCK